jgi:PKD repeat protein
MKSAMLKFLVIALVLGIGFLPQAQEPRGPLESELTLTILLRQGEFEKEITPLSGPLSAEEFYNYSLADYQSRTPIGVELPRTSLVFFYRQEGSNELALVIIHNAPDAGPAGHVRFAIDGLPPDAYITLKDDPNDIYKLRSPTAEFEWRWASGHTDGVIIQGLREPFTLTITPEFLQGIQRWKALTAGGPAVEVERVPLPSLSEPVQLAVGVGLPTPVPTPVPGVLKAAFVYSPEDVRVGVPVLFDARPSLVFAPDITLFEWDLDGDGTFDTSTTDPLITHTFEQSGTFTVTLQVTDPQGRTATASQTIEVREERPIVWRTISTPQARPGDLFRVVVDIQVEILSNGLGLEERLPRGWVIEPVSSDGAVFKFTGTSGQWLFPTLLKAGETRRIVYDVRVPPAEAVPTPLPKRFTIEGQLTSVSPAYTVPVGGESEIEVVSCLSVPVALAHLDLPQGRINLKADESISSEQLLKAIEIWQRGEDVPATCNAKITPDDLQKILMHALLGIPVDRPLPPPLTDPAQAPVTVTREITTPLPKKRLYLKAEGGNVFTVKLTIKPKRDLPGLHIIEQLPQGWQVRSAVPSAVPFRFSSITAQVEWVFPERLLAGEVRILTYDVIVPEDVEPGSVELKGEAVSGLATFRNPIAGDSIVEIVECLSIPMAIAHYNVKTGTIDLALDNLITREQANAAFRMWLEDEEVPGTCGRKLDIATLQRIIELMVTGTPVED